MNRAANMGIIRLTGIIHAFRKKTVKEARANEALTGGQPMEPKKRGPQPGSEKAKHGGQAVREKYGPDFYSKIGKKGGEAVKEKHGPAFYAEIGKKGGETTKREHGPEFYSRIGKKGGERGRMQPKANAGTDRHTSADKRK
jgi:general stress protein YciG